MAVADGTETTRLYVDSDAETFLVFSLSSGPVGDLSF
jgi:hypothetical protein